MEAGYLETMDNLLKARKGNKNKEPTKAESNQYFDAWSELAAAEGYSERAEQYLYSGIAFCGAKPIKAYFDKAEDKNAALTAFFNGEMYKADAEGTLRLLANLLALLLNDKESAPFAAEVLTRLSIACMDKNNKPSGKVKGTLPKYFIYALDVDAELLPLSEIKVTRQAYVEDFIESVEMALGSIKLSNSSKFKTKTSISKVEKWIADYKATQGKAENNAEIAEVIAPETESVSKPEAVVSVTADAAKPNETAPAAETKKLTAAANNSNAKTGVKQSSNKKANDAVDADAEYLLDTFVEAMKATTRIEARISSQKKIIAELKKLNDALTAELKEAKEKIQLDEQQIAKQDDTIINLRKENFSMESEIRALKQDIKQLEAVVAEKDAEISDKITMMEIQKRDMEKNADEALQRIASKIKFEYRDFMDAIDVPMSCDLGDNMREQLKNVFNILEKGGMKIK